MNPLLSICIPTFNRAAFLERALAALVPQLASLREHVELVISDNASDDRTVAVVESARALFPIRYHRNDSNVGVVANFRMLVEQLAQGEYCWVLGDDDRVRQGGVAAVLRILRSQPEVDYVYVNYLFGETCTAVADIHCDTPVPPGAEAASSRLTEGRVARWADLLQEDSNCLTAFYCSVFRRMLWMESAPVYVTGTPFSSALNTFPHAVILTKAMLGGTLWSTGTPWVVSGCMNGATWVNQVSVVMLLRLHEYLDELQHLGVARHDLDAHRRKTIRNSRWFLCDVLRGEIDEGMESFSLYRYILRQARYRETWLSLATALRVTRLRSTFRKFPLLAFPALPLKAAGACIWAVKKRSAATIRSTP